MRRNGFTLIELLIVLAIMGLLLGMAGAFLSQQTRVTAASQARNEAELAARTVAEGVAQDFQLAGSRAVYVGGSVDYDDIGAANCNEKSRAGCVLAHTYSSTGTASVPATEADINGYAIYYRSSLTPAEHCRRVDFALIEAILYRSDLPCELPFSGIDLEASAFAEGITSFAVSLACSDGSGAHKDPADCYDETDAYVTQVAVHVDVRIGGRMPTTSTMRLASFTPNLRPSVNYGLPPTAEPGAT